MLLPVCSLGVIPIAREMRRARISGGAILAFAMTAPLFNPLSMLYGLTLSAPFVILSFAFCTMVVVTAVGAIWNRIFPGTVHEEPAPPPVAYGVKRMVAILVVAAREIVGPSLGYILIGLTGCGPAQRRSCRPAVSRRRWSTRTRTPRWRWPAVAIPAYATPLVAMSQLGSMFQHANSVGAAFVLLTLGAGINLGLIAWVFRNYGLGRGLTWLAILLTVVLALRLRRSRTRSTRARSSRPAIPTPSTSTAARSSAASEDLPRLVLAKLKEDLHPFERVGLTVLAVLAATGLALQVARPPLAHRGLAGAHPGAGRAPRLPVRRRGPGPGPGRDRPGRAGGAQRGGLLRLLPGASGGLQGDVHPPGRGVDRGDERQPEARDPLHPDLGRLDATAPGGRLPPRGVGHPVPADEGQGLPRPARVPQARRRGGRQGRDPRVHRDGRPGLPPDAPGLPRDAVIITAARFPSFPSEVDLVLLQDGWTVKTMTVEEFKAAPKATGR